ncbi:tetratricopeptide repeat protein [Nostoc sp. FACHB-110]|uniref:nSTAND1 domain-containing NTPase n=1 Tax=Nostoc sp. FACHB-110 TaxID=2692834 RepID=UPI001688320E|nr:tetratricopeptide repeat protein [Nostoc sp. FACHB-110]MBD2435458.1 PD40 domain-containing protein [Nostoc sp. FACHB-110]
MRNQQDGENLTPENERSLQTLVRAITLSQGEFSLILLRCNYGALRQQITRRLHALSPLEIREISLPTSVKTLYTSIVEQLGDEQPEALMVFGLESVQDIDSVLTTANRVREEFRNNFRFPVLLWVNDQILQKLIRLATDLESWTTAIVFESSTHELIELIQQITDEIFHGHMIPHAQVCWELNQANQDLQRQGVDLDPALSASLAFVRGWYDYLHDDIDAALESYQQSLNFWQGSNHLERQGILLFHLGLAGERQAQKHQGNLQTARDYFQTAIAVLEAGQFRNLVAKYINKLGEVLRHLQAWDELQSLANKSLTLQQSYGTALQVAQCYGFLAEVALEKARWSEAQDFAKRALASSENVADEQIHERGLYRLILARAQYATKQINQAIANLELAKDESDHQYNPRLYISILAWLREWYFEEKEYLQAFRLKLQQLRIEQQYKFRAFVGASYLNPQRQEINTTQLQGEKTGTIADEIRASGRELDVNRLRDKITGNQNKLIVIHGQSGVGKSSILQAGLIPALQQQSIQAREALPVLVRVYSDWVSVLGRGISEAFEAVRRSKLAVDFNSDAVIIEQLHLNNERKFLTVLIFDQFEEFFFVYPDKEQRREFYDFLRVCLDIPFVKVVLSLREDYLHYLLELERLFDLAVVDNNILDKQRRYYLGNFSIEDTKKVIKSLTERTQFYLEDELVEQLVSDLAGKLGEVRPIELQIVGAQLQTENITRLAQYQQVGTKEKLVERFLEDVIRDCGTENERLARLVLYLLTDENGTRPLKTRAELVEGLAAEVDKLDLVLEIFVESGLVLFLPESPADRYQLVHDYLVAVIRQQQGNEILAELAREREQRQLTEEELKRVEQKNKILADAQREADQKIKQGRNRLLISSGLSICLLAVTGLYASSLFQQAESAKGKQQASEKKFNEAQRGLQTVKQEKQQTEIQLAKNRKQAQELANQSKNLNKNYQAALKNKQEAEAKFKAAQLESHKASENLANAKADLDKVNKEAANLQQKNAEAEARIKNATEKVKAAEVKAQQAKKQQDDAEAKARQADETLRKAEAELANARKATEAAQAAQKEAQKGTELERAGVNALRQFEFAQLEALVAVMHSAKELKALVKDGRPLEKYPAISPMFALDSILSRITERNQLKGHQGFVLSVSFSPDGKTIATASGDGTARLWTVDGQLLLKLKGHRGFVYSVSFSPDGKTIATASDDGTARLWTVDGQLLLELKGHRGIVYSVSFSPDGKTIATASGDGTARLWTVDGQLLRELTGHQGIVYSVSFSPDGKIIATASSDSTARLWSVDGQLLRELTGHRNSVWGVSFSPDGKTIATASDDGTARLWTIDGQLLRELQGHRSIVYSVSFSPDGKTIATASYDRTARLWSVDGQLLRELKGHQGIVWGVSFSPDGKIIATASYDGTARLWSVDGQLLRELKGHRGIVWGVSFNPDGKTIATASGDGTSRLWSVDGQLLRELKGHRGIVYSVSFSPDGKTIATASGDGTARLWNVDGQLLRELKGHQGIVRSVSFSPDGKTIATASGDGTARLWNVDGQLLLELQGHQGGVWGVSFSPDGKTIATASGDGTARLWTVDGQLLRELTGHRGIVYSVSFSPDGKTIATASRDGTARLWTVDGQLLRELTGHQGSVWGVSFSPDGKTIATASDDSTARLWTVDGQLLRELKGHGGSVWGVSFSPDGKTIATASDDGTARLWPVQSLDDLLARGCVWLQYYLKNPIASEQDKKLCEGIK